MLKGTTSHGLCDRVWPPHTFEWPGRGGGRGCEQGGWRGGEGRGGVDRRSDNATSVDVEIDPHRRRLGRSQTDFALRALQAHDRETSAPSQGPLITQRRWHLTCYKICIIRCVYFFCPQKISKLQGHQVVIPGTHDCTSLLGMTWKGRWGGGISRLRAHSAARQVQYKAGTSRGQNKELQAIPQTP